MRRRGPDDRLSARLHPTARVSGSQNGFQFPATLLLVFRDAATKSITDETLRREFFSVWLDVFLFHSKPSQYCSLCSYCIGLVGADGEDLPSRPSPRPNEIDRSRVCVRPDFPEKKIPGTISRPRTQVRKILKIRFANVFVSTPFPKTASSRR